MHHDATCQLNRNADGPDTGSIPETSNFRRERTQVEACGLENASVPYRIRFGEGFLELKQLVTRTLNPETRELLLIIWA